MSNTKNDKRAQEIARKAQVRRRDKQYEWMLRWRKGEITGLECLEKISELENIVFVETEDFRPQPKGKK